jgi:hypothetical protein
MATSYTTLLGLALPVTGELSGTWGDTVNNYISNYIDAAVAGAQTVTTNTTLTKTTGSGLDATSSQYAIIIASPASANITITAPAASKIYTIINTSGTYTVTIRGAGPTTGVTLGVNEKAQVAWNGSDFVRIGASGGPGVFSSITNTGLTSGRVVYSTTNGLETDSANLLFNGTTLTANTLNLTNALGTTYGGTGLTSFTANGVVYASSSSVLATGSALTFDGTNLGVGGTASGAKLHVMSAGGVAAKFENTFNTGAAYTQVKNTAGSTILGQDATGGYLLTDYAAPLLFYINNSEQMRLTSTGLGIGTSSPAAKLDIQGGNIVVGTTTAGNSTASMTFGKVAAGGGTINNRISLATYGTLYGAYMEAYADLSASTATYLAFGTTAGGGGSPAERMRLDASGNLGLGVTPSAWGTSNTRAIQIASANSTGATGALLSALNTDETILVRNAYYDGSGWRYVQSSSSATFYQQASNGQHVWQTAPSGTAGNAITFTQAMTLDASGNLGIGTSSPTYRLDTQFSSSTAYSASNTLTASPIAWFYNTNASAGVAATIRLDAGVTGGNAATTISAVNIGSGGSALTFGTRLNGSSDVVEKMRLDASGNLGLGITPSAWGPSSSYVALDIGDYAAIAGQTPSGGIEVTANCYGVYSAGSTTWRYKQSFLASRYQQGAGAHAWFTAPSGTAGNAITFTQAMTLTATGVFVVGATAISSDANFFAFDPGNAFADFGHITGVASGASYARFLYAGSSIGSITQSGTTAVLYNVTSDQRLKENIVDAPEFGSVIDSLQVRSFDWKSDNTHQRAGFVAQELVSVAPEAVHQPADPDEMMAVDYSKLVPMLVKEIQSLRIRITQLENKL